MMKVSMVPLGQAMEIEIACKKDGSSSTGFSHVTLSMNRYQFEGDVVTVASAILPSCWFDRAFLNDVVGDEEKNDAQR